MSVNAILNGQSTLTQEIKDKIDNALPISGGTMTGELNVQTPSKDTNATTKQYVDEAVAEASGMKFVEVPLPEKPSVPVAEGEVIPYSWKEINDITLAGKAREYFSLGSIKTVNLSEEILGTTSAQMIVIGYDCDGENTTTFQTKNMLNDHLPKFGTGSTSALWIGSTAREYCQQFYNVCDAKDYIKVVSKGTSTACNDSRNNDVVYNNETVFLPSEGEMGLYTNGVSPSNKEFCKQNTSNTPYQYYTDNNKRIKNLGDSGNADYYWERSRRYDSSYSGFVCGVRNGGGAVWNGWSSSNYGLAPAFAIGNGELPKDYIAQGGEDVTERVGAALGTMKLDSKAVLPVKPAVPIAEGAEIPYSGEEINDITLAGKAKEYFSLGAIKTINLSEEILGTTSAQMIVIGYDCDGKNTTTFQTKNMLNTYLPKFGTDSTGALWIGSTAREYCQQFYNVCDAKDYIKIISKGTSVECNGRKDNDVVYNNETVFLPSECEMGFSAIYSSSNKEFCKQNTSNTPYQYYTDNNKRIKNLGDSGNADYYWERSRSYNSSNSNTVCGVYSNGSASGHYWNLSYGGLAPAFAIGNGTPPMKDYIAQGGEDITERVGAALGTMKLDTIHVETGSYTGTGTYGESNPNSLTFEFEPKIVFLRQRMSDEMSSEIIAVFTYGDGAQYQSCGYSSSHFITVNWGKNTVSWFSTEEESYQLNGSRTVYSYVAIG